MALGRSQSPTAPGDHDVRQGRPHGAVRSPVQGPSWDIAFEVLERLTTNDLGDVEPFGFADGLSQPTVDWEGKRKIHGDQLEYSNVVALGEFLLGYSNEYNEYTDRPLLDPSSRGASELLPALDQPQKKDLGSQRYLPRHPTLEQDVRGFWQLHGPCCRIQSGTE